jgi:acetyltransferase-like isoleucine patch superfamily enzyme
VQIFLSFIHAICASTVRWLQWASQRAHFSTVEVKIGRRVVIDKREDCELSIGPHTIIGLGTLLILESQGGLRTRLQIGHHTVINEYNNIRAAGGGVTIGNYCQIAQFCTLVSSNHSTETASYMIEAPWAKEKISIDIEDDVWIGSNSVILPGVRIGRGAVIGAGSVVTKDVPPHCIYAGNPARLIRHRTLYAE